MLAQEELALALVHALSHLAADLLLQLQIGQRPIGPGDSQFKAPLDIEGLQDLHFLLEGQVGRIAGGVDQGARVGDTPEHLRHLGNAPGLNDVLNGGTVDAG